MAGATQTVALVVVALAFLAGCGGEEQGEATDTGKTQAVEAGDPERGKEIYLTSGCGACHTFKAADSTRNVGPNLDEAVQKYDTDFIRESIVNPAAYVEKGEAGSIGGTKRYGTRMPAYGPDEDSPNTLSEQQIADLVAFLTQGKE